MKKINQYLTEVRRCIETLPQRQIKKFIDMLEKAYKDSKQIFIMGNGGSAATASHFAVDLNKGTVVKGRKRLKAMALTDNIPYITALANDQSYENIFSEQLSHFVNAGDIVIAISASGNSKNILKAVSLARKKRALTLGLTGMGGGRLKDSVAHCIVVNSDNMQQVEDIHVILAHIIFNGLRDRIRSYNAKGKG